MNKDIKMIAMGCKPDPTKFKIKDYAVVGRFIPNKLGWSLARAAARGNYLVKTEL